MLLISTVERNMCYIRIVLHSLEKEGITMSSLLRIFSSSLNVKGFLNNELALSKEYVPFRLFLHSLEKEGIRRGRKWRSIRRKSSICSDVTIRRFGRKQKQVEFIFQREMRIEASFRFEDFDFGVEDETRTSGDA